MNTKENKGRRWLTTISCPHCREEHDVYWPYGAFPGGTPRCRFECPSTSRIVVFPTATVWGQTSIEEAPALEILADPFPE
jgi:hypothetical protein